VSVAVDTPPLKPSRRIDTRKRTLRQHAARGTLVNTGFMIFVSALGLVRGFILAGFLSREAYGIWGILVVSLGTLLWLKQVGIGDKFIQQDEADQEAAFQKALTLELMFTGAFTLLLLLALPVIAIIYGEPRLLGPGFVILLTLPAGALQAPLWIFYRDLNFLRQRTLQAVEPVMVFVVSIGLAMAGFEYWALAVGVVAGAWTSAVLAMAYSPYKLRLRYDRQTLSSYVSFSWPLVISGGASMVIAQSSILAGEARLGVAGVGVVALAANITAFTQRVDGLVTNTLYPAVCAVRDRIDLLEESFTKSNRLALMWAMPFGFGLTLFSYDLIHFGLGDKWLPAVEMLQITGATAAVAHIAFNWDAYMRAVGNTRAIAVASVAAMVTFVALGLPLLWRYGLRGLAVGIALQALAHVACRIYFLRGLFKGFSYLRQAARSIAPTIPAVGIVLLMRLAEPTHRTFGIAVAEVAAYATVSLVATFWLEGKLLREAVSYVRARTPAAVAD
jgi:O-antigen/teichoic acid export membrane protein